MTPGANSAIVRLLLTPLRAGPMNVTVLLSTFGLVFLAELGDKTQLTAMALATRLPWQRAFLGMAAAFAVLNVLAVGVGRVLFELAPLPWIQLAAAALFLFFGIATLRGEDDAEEGAEDVRVRRGPFLTSFVLIFMAELGDKTQLLTASLAAQHASPFQVFAGSTLALWLVSALGLLVGGQLGRWLPPRVIRRGAGVLFLVFAAVMAGEAIRTWGS